MPGAGRPTHAGARNARGEAKLASVARAATMRGLIAGAAAIGSLAMAVPARAQVTVSATRVVIDGPGVRAVIDRAPYRLRIAPAPGQPAALSEVAGGSATPAVLPPTQDPVPPGTDAQSSGQLYAPLSFLVGNETIQQYNGLVWGGNLMSGERSGIQYSAQRVLGAVPSGTGVRLSVSTNDPSGRLLTVEVQPTATGVVSVSAVPAPAAGVAMMSDSFSSDGGEAFHGFGGRHDLVDQHGRALSSFVEEENIDGATGDNSLGAADLFPNGQAAAYYPQAQFISSRGYGFLLDQPSLSRFRLDSDRPDAWSVAASAPALDYLVAPGAPAQAIGDLTAVSGRQPVPPAWALGPMFDRLVKNLGESQADYEAALRDDLAQIDSRSLPLHAFRIEGWGFPDPSNDGFALHSYVGFAAQTALISALRARAIHPLVYLRPWITPGSSPDRAGLTVRRGDGSTYTTTGTTGQRIALLDFTNPAAVRFWQQELAKIFDLGADGFMQDFGEEVLYDMHFADGETGTSMHNRYLALYAQATRQEIAAYESSHPGRELWFFTRAGYSGTPGSAAFEGGNFPGDETTDWSHAAGLASLAPDMLNRAIGGAYGFATDIGGYYDYTTPPTTKELFLRWAEWAALSPIFRLHGSGRSGTHTPWSYDAQTVQVYRELSLLHEHAAPLIMALWRHAQASGIPPTRPLWLEFPGDATAAEQDQEWMLGDDVLVAPVVTQGASSRSVYLPAGCWREPDSGQVLRGPQSVEYPAPLIVLPYFVRCGSEPFSASPATTARRPAARCSSRRRFVVHVRLPRGAHVRSASILGRRARTSVQGRLLSALVDLRGRGIGRVRVRIVVRLSGGRVLRQTRRYHPCVARRRRRHIR